MNTQFHLQNQAETETWIPIGRFAASPIENCAASYAVRHLIERYKVRAPLAESVAFLSGIGGRA